MFIVRRVNMDAQIELFRKQLPLQVKLREIVRLIGPLENKTCLDVGLDDPLVSRQLRRRGGTWHTVVRQEAIRPSVLEAVGERVELYDGYSMPFDDKTFDIVVVSDFLEHVKDDSALITESHRVLKSTGELIVHVPRAKRWTALKPFETLFGVTHQKADRQHAGYTEAELFHLLKQGFDVHSVRSYSKFFVELVDMIADSRVQRLLDSSHEHVLRVYAHLYPFYWLAYQLDSLLFFTRGYYLVAKALRHPWRARKAPILNDGRSISEVVLRRIKD